MLLSLTGVNMRRGAKNSELSFVYARLYFGMITLLLLRYYVLPFHYRIRELLECLKSVGITCCRLQSAPTDRLRMQ